VVLWRLFALLAGLGLLRPRPPVLVHPAMFGATRMPLRRFLTPLSRLVAPLSPPMMVLGFALAAVGLWAAGEETRRVLADLRLMTWTALVAALLLVQARLWFASDSGRSGRARDVRRWGSG
jgi:hypothetical protein